MECLLYQLAGLDQKHFFGEANVEDVSLHFELRVLETRAFANCLQACRLQREHVHNGNLLLQNGKSNKKKYPVPLIESFNIEVTEEEFNRNKKKS